MKQTLMCILWGWSLLFCSCSEEELNVYQGSNYVYFTYMEDKSAQEVEFNFATDAPLVREGKVTVKMTLLGYLLEKDATCSLSVVEDKTTAQAGIDYAPLAPGIFHSGAVEDGYEVTVYRDEELLNTDYTLTLSLDEVEGCLVGPSEYKHVTIKVTDAVSKPVWWEQSAAANLGVYSDRKYRVFIIFMDGEILESLDKYTGIEFANLIVDFKAWWKEQWELGNYHYYDADGVTPLYETILDN